MTEPWRDPETLRSLYYDENHTTREIAERLGCGESTIWRWMEKFGFDRREPGAREERDRRYRDEEWLPSEAVARIDQIERDGDVRVYKRDRDGIPVVPGDPDADPKVATDGGRCTSGTFHLSLWEGSDSPSSRRSMTVNSVDPHSQLLAPTIWSSPSGHSHAVYTESQSSHSANTRPTSSRRAILTRCYPSLIYNKSKLHSNRVACSVAANERERTISEGMGAGGRRDASGPAALCPRSSGGGGWLAIVKSPPQASPRACRRQPAGGSATHMIYALPKHVGRQDAAENDRDGEPMTDGGRDQREGQLPERFVTFAREEGRDRLRCRGCGERVRREILFDRLCPGCRYRTETDGGSASVSRGEPESEPVTDGGPEACGNCGRQPDPGDYRCPGCDRDLVDRGRQVGRDQPPNSRARMTALDGVLLLIGALVVLGAVGLLVTGGGL